MAVRGLFTGDLERRVVPPPAVARARRTAASTRCSRSRTARRRTSSTAAPGRSRSGSPTSSATRSASSAPVRSITQHDDRVVVDAGDVVGRRPGMPSSTVPPALALEIAFDPALPDDRLALYRNAVAGPGDEDARRLRRAVLARRRLQRSDVRAGLGGRGDDRRVAGVGHPRRASRRSRSDRSPSACDALDPDERREPCSTRSRRGSARVRLHPSSSSRRRGGRRSGRAGCSMAHLPPGILTRYGPLLREPFGRVHWAGTETSTTSHGAIDGAVRSGERAAGRGAGTRVTAGRGLRRRGPRRLRSAHVRGREAAGCEPALHVRPHGDRRREPQPTAGRRSRAWTRGSTCSPRSGCTSARRTSCATPEDGSPTTCSGAWRFRATCSAWTRSWSCSTPSAASPASPTRSCSSRTGADLGFFPIDDHAEALAEDVALLIATPYLAPLRMIAGRRVRRRDRRDRAT